MYLLAAGSLFELCSEITLSIKNVKAGNVTGVGAELTILDILPVNDHNNF